MTTIVDDTSGSGSAANAIKALSEPDAAPTQAQPTVQPNTQPNKGGGDKFAGKSPEQLIEMYNNLESHAGRLASQLGQLRLSADELILQKRATDLRNNGGSADQAITPVELLERPQEALDKFVTNKVSQPIGQLQQRLAQLEAALSGQQLVQTHGNTWQATAASPEFQEWARRTPLRMGMAEAAARGDFNAASSLLTEYKDVVGQKQQNVDTQQQTAQRLAGRAALESAGTTRSDTAGATPGPIYKRADIIALRANNPDEYENPAFQAKLLRAYQEGRVR
jgi:hypothetical protein